MTSEGSVHADC